MLSRGSWVSGSVRPGPMVARAMSRVLVELFPQSLRNLFLFNGAGSEFARFLGIFLAG